MKLPRNNLVTPPERGRTWALASPPFIALPTIELGRRAATHEGWPISSEVGNTNSTSEFAIPAAKGQRRNNFPAVLSVQAGRAQPRYGAKVVSQGREPLDRMPQTDSQAPEGRQVDRRFCRPFGAFRTRDAFGSQGLAPLANNCRLFKAKDRSQKNTPRSLILIFRRLSGGPPRPETYATCVPKALGHPTSRITGIGARVLVLVLAWASVATAADEGWLETTVQRVSDRRPVVTLAVGDEQGAAVGDRVVLIRDGVPIGAGTIIVLGPATAGVALSWVGETARSGEHVILLPGRILRQYRDALPAETSVVAEISALNRDGGFGWIDVGRSVGLGTGDRWLVWRGAVPIARGEAVLLDAKTALLELTPIVRDLRPTVGDRVRLVPTPAERASGRQSATVLHVRTEGGQQVLTLGTTEPERFHPEDRLDVSRDGRYLAYAKVTRVSLLLVEVKTERARTREPVKMGDRAVRRPGRRSDRPGVTGHLFRIEESAGLITVGELDGVQVGDTWSLRRDRRVVMQVDAVYAEHCRVELGNGTRADHAEPALWDEVRLEPDDSVDARSVGSVAPSGSVPWLARLALPRQNTTARSWVKPGTIVRFESQPPTAGLILAVSGDRATVYCPRAWGKRPEAGVKVTATGSAGTPVSR